MSDITSVTVFGGRSVRGDIKVSGDKSISHRAALFAAMAKGKSIIEGFSPGNDCKRTLNCIHALGCEVDLTADNCYVIKSDGIDSWNDPVDVLNAGNSGTTARLLLGVLAASNVYAVLTGDSSLRFRPMQRVIEPLLQMGAHIHARGDYLPVSIVGGELRGIEYRMSVASAQVKTAILLAGLKATGTTIVHESGQSRDHTERLLSAFGVEVEVNGSCVTVDGGTQLRPANVQIPGDMSSAAFWVVAAVLCPGSEVKVTGVNINPTRTGLIDALIDMGADIEVAAEGFVGREPIGTIVARSSELQGADIRGEQVVTMIDEIPLLALAATQARGQTVIGDARELRVKESDRLKATALQLNRLGGSITETEDGLFIDGDSKLQGAVVDSHRDHRMAMMLSIAGLCARGETKIRGADAAAVSYPGWWRELHEATGCLRGGEGR